MRFVFPKDCESESANFTAPSRNYDPLVFVDVESECGDSIIRSAYSALVHFHRCLIESRAMPLYMSIYYGGAVKILIFHGVKASFSFDKTLTCPVVESFYPSV